jgi:hypothetical protein
VEISTLLTAAKQKQSGWVEFETAHPEIRKVATSDQDIIREAMPYVGTGQPVTVEAGEPANPVWRDRNGFTHPNPHYLNGVKPDAGNIGAIAQQPYLGFAGQLAQEGFQPLPPPTERQQQISQLLAPQPMAQPPTAAAQVPLPQADDRGPVMGRNNIAAAVAPKLIELSDQQPETIQAILEGLARWSETGGPVFGLPPHPANAYSS